MISAQLTRLPACLALLVAALPAHAQDPTPAAAVNFPEVTDVDHAALIRAWDDQAFERGKKIYQTVCFACHGIDGRKVTVEGARAFAVDPLVHPNDPYSLFKTITFGYATMPQQKWMSPGQRYDVVHYIREEFLKKSNPKQYAKVDAAYLKKLPKPAAGQVAEKEEKQTDFGPVLCSGLGRDFPLVLNHRLTDDVTLSYDLLRMRTAGAWKGGFLGLDNTRFTQQRGESPVEPGGEALPGLGTWMWAYHGSFDYDKLPPRSPAPPEHMEFRGHFVHGDHAVMSYCVAGTRVLEMPRAEMLGDSPLLRHTLHIDASKEKLELCVAEMDQAGPVTGVMPIESSVGGRMRGPAGGSLALLTADEAPESGGARQARFISDVEQARNQLAMAERPFTAVVRFRTDRGGTLIANARLKGKWMRDGKSLFVDGGGRLTYDIGWLGAIQSKQRVKDGRWHTALLTMDDGKARLFLDGKLAAEREDFARPHVKNSVFKIGSTAANFGGDFNGEIEWVRFFKQALDDEACRKLSQGSIEDSPEPAFLWPPKQATKPGPANPAGPFRFFTAAAVSGQVADASWRIDDGRRLVLEIPPADEPRTIEVLRHAGNGPPALAAFARYAEQRQLTGKPTDLTTMISGGPNRFPQPITVKGKLGEDINGYALDTIPLPDDNPYGAWMRTSCLGFFDDGRCAVGTYTGDIWIVSGIDRGLEHVTWQRYASGLYEPFGLLVIDGLIYVTCRDGIKRLHDLNDDGHADYYETFFADPDVSSFFHAFCFDLQRDTMGHLYYAKSGQYTSFKEAGAVVQVAPDGRSFEYFATGFRTPNGMGMMPNDLPLCSDNEGNWMPASKISMCRKGGFYGYVQTHSAGRNWAPDGGKIDHTKVKPPETYDQPILWLPTSEDNSSGSQLWVDDKRFGPLTGTNGRLMHSSFGKGWVYYLMLQEVDGRVQAACVTLPHQWDAGVQRLRTNPADGQLYGAGLSGWQGPRGGKDGCLQRLRHSGGECRIIDDVKATAEGLELRFNFDLDPESAADPASYELSMWNYQWRPQYGSKFYSVREPGKTGTDKLKITGIRVAADKRKVNLTIEDFVPCQQLLAKLRLQGADGREFNEKFHQTIHRIPER